MASEEELENEELDDEDDDDDSKGEDYKEISETFQEKSSDITVTKLSEDDLNMINYYQKECCSINRPKKITPLIIWETYCYSFCRLHRCMGPF
jgi:hypothetical protein